MIMPSIALPTGPYDWHSNDIPLAVFEARLAKLRAVMQQLHVTHAVIHGNIFDHTALHWLTHFTPKLGPAYALVPAAGPLRLLFAGGPGMKPSALQLTWVEDVAAIKSIGPDVKRWLGETAAVRDANLGLVEGNGMLLGDWRKVTDAGGGTAIELDAHLKPLIAQGDDAQRVSRSRAQAILGAAQQVLGTCAQRGITLHSTVLDMERAAYAAGAADVRVKASRRHGGPPTRLPDAPSPLQAETRLEIAVRFVGEWASTEMTLTT